LSRHRQLVSIPVLLTRWKHAASSEERIGFIGLGNMGAHMARNLTKKGLKLVVLDMNQEIVNSFVANGAVKASTPSEVAKLSTTIITMLPSSPHVRSVYTGENGLLTVSVDGKLLIDCSTIDPTTSKDLAKAAGGKKANAVDAPVSGGVGGAEAGTLTFMVGGSKQGFEKAQPILAKMGKNIVHCGDNGTGQVAKICNNMLLAIGMIGTAEAMNLGTKFGLDPKLLAGIINTSSGRCWSSDIYNPCPGVLPNVPASRNYEGGFGTALMTKDLSLAQMAAKDSKSKTPLGDLAFQVYSEMTEAGLDKKDFSVVYKYLNEMSRN